MPAPRRIALLVTAARVSFAAVLLPWFWIGAVSKLAGHTLSVGPAAGPWPLNLRAFHAFVPRVMDSAAAPGTAAVIYVWIMTLAELVLPPMVAVGLFARWSATLLIGQMVLGWGLAMRPGQAGALFDPRPYDAVPDQLLLWSALILPIALFGPAPCRSMRSWPVCPAAPERSGRARLDDARESCIETPLAWRGPGRDIAWRLPGGDHADVRPTAGQIRAIPVTPGASRSQTG